MDVFKMAFSGVKFINLFGLMHRNLLLIISVHSACSKYPFSQKRNKTLKQKRKKNFTHTNLMIVCHFKIWTEQTISKLAAL